MTTWCFTAVLKALNMINPIVHPGLVSLVGAGPGAVDLLTLRALNRIQRAEVVVHDRLIGADIMALIPAGAQRIYVGKAARNHAVAQAKIEDLLIQQARLGKRVVRLKGGDPFVFGRGGEEVQALEAARIPFEVIPGVTAATGCSAAAGIPLTHRNMASSCVFLSGHLADESREPDWRALAQPGQTRIFYMGVERLAHIAQRLIAYGLPASTPAAVVQDGTHASQSVLAMELQSLVQCAPAYGPRPGLLIIGETVALSPHYLLVQPAPDAAAEPCRA